MSFTGAIIRNTKPKMPLHFQTWIAITRKTLIAQGKFSRNYNIYVDSRQIPVKVEPLPAL